MAERRPWAIVILNPGWRARTLVPLASARAEAAGSAPMFAFVVPERGLRRRLGLGRARRRLRRALGASPAASTSVVLASSVATGAARIARAVGSPVIVARADDPGARRLAELGVDVQTLTTS